MNAITIILALTALVEISIVFLILSKPKKNAADNIFIFWNVFIIAWIILDIFYSLADSNILFWSNATYISALLLPFLYLHFGKMFLSKKDINKKWFFTSAVLPIVILILLLVDPTNMIYRDESGSSFGYIYFLYIFYMVVYFVIGYVILFRKSLSFRGVKRRQVNIIFYGSLIASSAALVSALLLPLIENYSLYFFSPAFTLILSVCITYSVFKHHLFDVKIITTEIFSVVIVLISLVNVLLSQSRAEFILKLGLFIGVSIFTILLIKGVLNEVNTREKISKMAKSLKKANVELQKLDKAKSEFISIASHQLRTPISVIKGVASMMIEGDLDKLPEDKKDRFVKSLWDKSCKLESIISDILNATEMTNSTYRVKEEKAELIDSKEFIEKIINDFQAVVQERNIDLFLKDADKPLPKIYGQRQYLQEAVGNLIDNAIKYTPSTGTSSEARDRRDKKGVVSVSVTKEKNNVIISIEDNGIGIPKKEIAGLFRKFARGSNARDMYTDGSGLGLFVVKEIVKGHYGKVWAESKVGKGTKFFISLPISHHKKINIKEHIINDGK